MKTVVLALVVLAAVAIGRRAEAYPQYQFSHDVTCTGCHYAPDGGGFLDENGLNVAQSEGWKDHDPAFVYGKLGTPSWLQLGGDLRGAAGFAQAQQGELAAYPMQGEVAARVEKSGFSFMANAGFRRPSDGASVLHVAWSREHYAMWQQKPGESSGLFVRAGRFQPTFGLRLAEHVAYTQKYGGRRLYDETYGVGVSYVTSSVEVHGTGFIADPIASTREHGNGGALYAEKRLGDHAAVGVEGKYSHGDEETRTYGGVTAKVHIPGPDVLLLGEAQLIRDHILALGGDRASRIATYVMASHPLPHHLLLDVGVGHYTQDTRVKGLFRDCVDANVHWFYDSHAEFLVTTRFETLDLGGKNGGYALAQLHVRL